MDLDVEPSINNMLTLHIKLVLEDTLDLLLTVIAMK